MSTTLGDIMVHIHVPMNALRLLSAVYSQGLVIAVPLVAVLLTLLVGCRTQSTPPDPPTGGRPFVLDYEDYLAAVEPVLVRNGCNALGGCHGGGIRGDFALSPPDEFDSEHNFRQVFLQVDPYDPEQSPLLTKPLASAAGGAPHSDEPFRSLQDPDYQAILQWIRRGEFQ